MYGFRTERCPISLPNKTASAPFAVSATAALAVTSWAVPRAEGLMEPLVLLLLALACAGILTASITWILRQLGIRPARPEERTRGIELLLERLRDYARRRTHD